MSLFRKTILTFAGNPLVTSFVSTYGMGLGASRFVAGENLTEALHSVQNINQEGLLATLDHLGESVAHHTEAHSATRTAENLFDAIHTSKINSNVSVKLTQLGLDIDRDFCLENMDRITAQASKHNNFIRIDMEDSPRIDDTLYILHQLIDKYGKKHIGAVIQSYLLRSEHDVTSLGKKGINLRIVKGAYKEPREVAFRDKKDVDKNYIHLVQLHLTNDCYTAIATHDESIIQQLCTWIREKNIPSHLYEFQMLYGIRTDLQKSLTNRGYRVRVYIPYGKEWYPYFTRRLAERPANALFLLRNLRKRI